MGDIDGCILPIELVDFRGSVENESILLNWNTENEVNNAGFYVQRGWETTEGQVDFYDLGFVAAQPNGQGNGSYDFTDADFGGNRTHFYRLRQLDQNGASHYHRIIEFTPENDGETDGLAVYPNPFREQLTVILTGDAPGNIRISDIAGRLVLEKELPPGTHQLELSNLESGVYLYRLYANGKSKSGKLIRL